MTTTEEDAPMTVNRWTGFWFVVSAVLIIVVILGGIGIIYERNNNSRERVEWMRACHHVDFDLVVDCLERAPW
jgi:hypothetical protein